MAGSTATATVTSPDGLVHATVDSTGTLTGLEFAPTAFERTDPATLARTVLDTVREGGKQAARRLEAAAPPVPPRPTPKRARHARQV
ncbi:YbaB/EbfC DNA-binding family protein [Prauserella shujinwangii]|uniref:YbaB/EbfC DNA-binding family protein n=1 Tax=Prauserella shujinwangii TaxID=1453103 RepID=A0A2T0LV38_9PSEU|nr:YbaB/EbfC family nucleoid-associated protein [Prauserella shujinwangii]PRX47695.1 YbaB/EbfC DNA-binding family protein [Prauserella shujinwangii]